MLINLTPTWFVIHTQSPAEDPALPVNVVWRRCDCQRIAADYQYPDSTTCCERHRPLGLLFTYVTYTEYFELLSNKSSVFRVCIYFTFLLQLIVNCVVLIVNITMFVVERISSRTSICCWQQ